jgi:DNA-binding transcriptional LysR family regulator
MLLSHLRQLECFVTVADELHFTRAAKRLHISQAGISAPARALERGALAHPDCGDQDHYQGDQRPP